MIGNITQDNGLGGDGLEWLVLLLLVLVVSGNQCNAHA